MCKSRPVASLEISSFFLFMEKKSTTEMTLRDHTQTLGPDDASQSEVINNYHHILFLLIISIT